MKTFQMFFLLISLFVFSSLSFCAEPQMEYYKSDETGVFSVHVKLAPKFPVETTSFSVSADGDQVYEMYIYSPDSNALRLSKIVPDRYGRWLTSEQNEKIEAIQKQINELYEKQNQHFKIREDKQNQMKGLKVILENLQKETIQDQTLIAKTNQNITQIENELLPLEKEQKEIQTQFSLLYQKQSEIYQYTSEDSTVKPLGEAALIELNILGRFRGSGKVSITLFAKSTKELFSDPVAVQTIDWILPQSNQGNVDLLKQWANLKAKELIVRVLDSPYTSFYQYWLMQAIKKYGVDSQRIQSLLTGNVQNQRNPDLYSVTTGALAIQESLQLEEMRNREFIPSDRSIELNTLEGPKIQSHPFQEMLKGRKPVYSDICALVPFDNYYCRFSSITAEIQTTDLLKQWGTSLLRTFTVSARDADLPARYMKQLCIDVSELTRLFGNYVIGELVLTGNDPFLREGTDLSVILEVKQPAIFDSVMDAYRKKTVQSFPDIKVDEIIFENYKILRVVNHDQSISAYSLYLDKYIVFSNSMDALIRIIKTFQKKEKSMLSNDDFQYMRTIFPADPVKEDGFLYLSDAFIRKLLSPKWKIQAQRRMICQNHLRMISNAWTMCRTDLQKNVPLETLIQEQFLDSSVLNCPDSGEYYLNESGQAFCSVHNRLQFCTPVNSVNTTSVSKEEATDYQNFVNNYNRYWSRYFDPIGIRFSLKEKIEVETCILPLIENSIYNQLRETLGGDPVSMTSFLPTPHTIVSFSSKLHLESRTLKQMDSMKNTLFPSLPSLEECIGSNISFHLFDSDVLFTFSEEGMNMFGGLMNLQEQFIFGLLVSSINLPIYLSVDLKDENKTKDLLRELFKIFQRKDSADSGRSRFSNNTSFERYSSNDYNDVSVHTLVFRFFLIKFRLHYAISENRLIVSTKRYVLEKALDSLKSSSPDLQPQNIQLYLNPKAFHHLLPSMKNGWQERMRKACLKNIEPIRVLIENYKAKEGEIDVMSKEVEGVTLRCPSKGKYQYDAKTNEVYCTQHGNINYPEQPEDIIENEGLIQFIKQITCFFVDFKFTKEGIMTKIIIDRKA